MTWPSAFVLATSSRAERDRPPDRRLTRRRRGRAVIRRSRGCRHEASSSSWPLLLPAKGSERSSALCSPSPRCPILRTKESSGERGAFADGGAARDGDGRERDRARRRSAGSDPARRRAPRAPARGRRAARGGAAHPAGSGSSGGRAALVQLVALRSAFSRCGRSLGQRARCCSCSSWPASSPSFSVRW